MIRETSVEAYHHVVESGAVGKRERMVYEIVYKRGPMTANAISRVVREMIGGSTAVDTNTCARLTKLRDMGVMREVGEAPDPLSGRRVILWDVTRNLPAPLPAKESNRQKIARLEVEVQRLIDELKSHGLR